MRDVWAVVEVQDYYPYAAPEAVGVWLFESEQDAQEWVDKQGAGGTFSLNILPVFDPTL